MQRSKAFLLAACTLLAGVAARPVHAAGNPLEELLHRTSQQVTSYLDTLSDVKCVEHVVQEKLGGNGKTVEKQESTFDYLVLLNAADGELDLVESRIPDHEPSDKAPQRPMLVSNGFATLFLVFHPYYASGFQFTAAGEETENGRTVATVAFQHIPGTRTPAAMAVGGREFPLDLTGTAWIDFQTGIITRIVAEITVGMEDVGLRTLRSRMEYAPVAFHDPPDTYWLPTAAVIEVETRHQHWRNTHRFSDYRRFSVNTTEQMASP